MATLVLGAAGAALANSALGVGIGTGIASPALISGIGKFGGNTLGSWIDQNVFGNSSGDRATHGASLLNPGIISNSYGSVIPMVYGKNKVAGSIIWASKIKENILENSHFVGGKMSAQYKHIHKDYNYSVSVALAVCSGPIASIDKIFLDNVEVKASDLTIRIYKGTEDQLPDPLIESIQGMGSAPAYRGLAYVVFENLNLTQFGNRLPHFEFEVQKGNSGANILEHKIEAITMIPGSGEFVYDPSVVSKMKGDGLKAAVNQHHTVGRANSVVSIEQMQETLPNIKWVSVVINWFADSLDIGKASILPGVEFIHGETKPHCWSVGGIGRKQAYCISRDQDGNLRYGGTSSDQSLLNYLKYLKGKGYKIMLNPMFYLDLPSKPWRGRLTGAAKDIDTFFEKRNGYNRFITHYASLCAEYVDAFLIGSELIGITQINDGSGNFPGVNKLSQLADKVRGILGAGVKMSYAADWSEYHHTTSGWYNLDNLWANPNIDFIGIDAYFPLTDWQSSKYSLSDVIKGWDSGEGYDYWYDDANRSHKNRLNAASAWKNLSWWLKNKHVNPNGEETAWMPNSKKIWFTEYGFPSVDLATNQPNVFADANSIEGGYPRYSEGEADILAQRIGIEATETRWSSKDIVENKFLWAWDARPFPTWPDRSDIWGDSKAWEKGHWVQGKLGRTTLANMIMELCTYAGIMPEDIDVSGLDKLVDGLTINQNASVKDVLDVLQKAYLFDVIEHDFKLKFVNRYNKSVIEVDAGDIIVAQGGKISHTNKYNANYFEINALNEIDFPNKIIINYINRSAGYTYRSYSADIPHDPKKLTLSLNFPMVFDFAYIANLAHILLHNIWAEKKQYAFSLPIKYLHLKPTDVIKVHLQNREHLIRVLEVELGKDKLLHIVGVSEDIKIYQESAKWEETLLQNNNAPLTYEQARIEMIHTHLEHLNKLKSYCVNPRSLNFQLDTTYTENQESAENITLQKAEIALSKSAMNKHTAYDAINQKIEQMISPKTKEQQNYIQTGLLMIYDDAISLLNQELMALKANNQDLNDINIRLIASLQELITHQQILLQNISQLSSHSENLMNTQKIVEPQLIIYQNLLKKQVLLIREQQTIIEQSADKQAASYNSVTTLTQNINNINMLIHQMEAFHTQHSSDYHKSATSELNDIQNQQSEYNNRLEALNMDHLDIIESKNFMYDSPDMSENFEPSNKDINIDIEKVTQEIKLVSIKLIDFIDTNSKIPTLSQLIEEHKNLILALTKQIRALPLEIITEVSEDLEQDSRIQEKYIDNMLRTSAPSPVLDPSKRQLTDQNSVHKSNLNRMQIIRNFCITCQLFIKSIATTVEKYIPDPIQNSQCMQYLRDANTMLIKYASNAHLWIDKIKYNDKGQITIT